MNSKIKTYILLFAASLFIVACGNSGHKEEEHEHGNSEESKQSEHGEEVHFSEQQFQSLDMEVDTLPFRNISSYVEAN